MAGDGWHADPWGRAQHRYYDGTKWTEHVSTNGVSGTDPAALSMPVPPAAPPPPPMPGAVTMQPPPHVLTAPPTKKRHTFRWIVLGALGVMVIGVIAAGANGSKDDDKPAATTVAGGTTTPTVSKGVGSKDASADVTDLAISEPDAIGFRYVTATVTNNSSKRSNYLIEVSIESADGKTQIHTTILAVSNLEPGQSTSAKAPATTKDLPADAKVVLKEVTRLAA